MSAPPPYPGNDNKQGPPPTAYPQQPGPGYNTQYGMQGQAYPQQPYGQPGYPQYGAPAGYPPPGQAPPPYPMGQGGYQGQPQGPTTVVVTTQPVLTQAFRETPLRINCPHCRAEIVTGTSYETGTFAWLVCAVLCIFGCDAGCCLIPFCMDGCKDVVHNCPNCNQVIGRYNRL